MRCVSATQFSRQKNLRAPHFLSHQIRTLPRPSRPSPSEKKEDGQTEFQSKSNRCMQLPSNSLQKNMLKIKPGPKKNYASEFVMFDYSMGKLVAHITCMEKRVPERIHRGEDTPLPLPCRRMDGGPRPGRDVGQPLHVPRSALAETGLGPGHRGHPDRALSTSTSPLPGGDPKGSNFGRSLLGPTNPTLSPLRRKVQRGGQKNASKDCLI